MRYKLPENVSSISAGGIEFTADDDGCIDVPDDTAAEIVTFIHSVQHHNLTPEAERMTDDPSDETSVETPAGEAVATKPKRKR